MRNLDPFVIAIFIAVGLAYAFPYPAQTLPLESIANYGIILIFFFYGLKLGPEKLMAGLSNRRLHSLIHIFTFIVFPLSVLALRPLFKGTEREILWMGMFFMAALPSTVSSSVVMVSIAKGNIPAAIFNATISGLIGIVVIPLWMSLFIQSGGADLSDVYIRLIKEIVIPLGLGLFLQKWWGKFAQKNSKTLSTFDKSVILLVIYNSFVESFEGGIFGSVKTTDFLILLLWVVHIFYAIFYTITWISKRLNFNREDRITAQFCGTKKSLVHGTVFSKIIFGNSASSGIILLPIMLFHAFQILAISIMAVKFVKSGE